MSFHFCRHFAVWAVVLFTFGCAPSGYVLNTRPPGSFLSHTSEDTLIAAHGNVALLYDRARWVIYERTSEDGSVWIYYALVVKNDGAVPVQLALEKVYLRGKYGVVIPGVFSAEEMKAGQKALPPHSISRFAVRFRFREARLDETTGSIQFRPEQGQGEIEASTGSDESLILVVPLRTGGELRQKVWLWKA